MTDSPKHPVALPTRGVVVFPGQLSLILAVVFCSGFIIFLLGIVLEYLALLVLHAHGKPIFFIADRRSDAILVDYFSKHHP